MPSTLTPAPATAPVKLPVAQTPHYLALDLEYNQPSRTIIQVGVAIGNSTQNEAEYHKHQWLIAVAEPLNPEIVALTGITDDAIASQGVSLAQCAQELSALIEAHQVFVNPVTWGGGDSQDLLQSFRQQGIDFPHFGRRWIDVKTWAGLLALARAGKPQSMSGGLKSIMGRFNLPFKGEAHRADVDAFNTLRLFFRILARQQKLESAAHLLRDL